MLASPCEKRVGMPAARSPPLPRSWRSTSARKSSMNSLHPSRSPQNATLEPITGPKSRSTGASRCAMVATNFGKAFEATTGSSRGAGASPRPGCIGALPPHFSRSVSMAQVVQNGESSQELLRMPTGGSPWRCR